MRVTLFLLLGSLLSFANPDPAASQDLPAPPRVRLQLVSELDNLVGGEEFLVGASYKLAPHWHVYWKNPGDSGLATEATLTAPEGFEVGPLMFPAPERLVLPGDLISYGYEDDVVLFWRVTAPKDLGEAESFTFRVDSEWLACNEICVRGAGDASLQLKRASANQPARRDTAVFGRSLKLLPRPLVELAGAQSRWEGPPDEPALVHELNTEARLTFIPEAEAGLDLLRTAQDGAEEHSILRRWYSFRPTADRPLPHVRGLLGVEQDGSTTYYESDLKRPSADEKETH